MFKSIVLLQNRRLVNIFFIMGKFFMDLEFTDGNFYMADIIEIAVIAEESGNCFHMYVRIHYSIPKRVQELTRINDGILNNLGCLFTDVMISMIDFIQSEQSVSDTNPIIVAHGGYYNDFPILFANCMKHGFRDYGILKDCLYVDSADLFKDAGYKRPGLDNLCREFKMKREFHSALEDALILKRIVCDKRLELYDNLYTYTFNDIETCLNMKLPIPIEMIYNVARKCLSYRELASILFQSVKKKTALNKKQYLKVAYYYFIDRYIFCK